MDVNFEGNTKKGTDEWLTPPEIIKALGEFDLDPCSPINRPWPTANKHYTIEDNGLLMPWDGRVWCNPPYDTKVSSAFLNKCALHDNAIVLIFARTETNNFFEHIWNKADSVLFIKGRLKFYTVDGKQGGTAGAPSVLVAYGKNNSEALKNSGIKGKLIQLK